MGLCRTKGQTDLYLRVVRLPLVQLCLLVTTRDSTSLMSWASKSGAQHSSLFGQLWLKQPLWSCLFAWERRWMCVISLPRHISIIFLYLFFFLFCWFVCVLFCFLMRQQITWDLQCKLHQEAEASEHEKTEGTEFFNGSSSEILKIPRSTWNVKALKIVVLGLHKGKAVREPVDQVMKLNLWNVGRKCGTECGAEGIAAEVSSRKSKWVLGRHERNIVHLCGIVQPYPFCDSVPWLPQESTGKCCVQQTDPNPVRLSLVFHISSAKNVC